MGESLFYLGALVLSTGLVGGFGWLSSRASDRREDALVARVKRRVLAELSDEELARRVDRGRRALERR